ncbi:MAG TPA: pilus (MSHA type) biogenesis protein MshL [Rhodocyclaceae bacterium]|nr:pilus (MSHA type) biogenesis protein MshL [Rhodocyclaceae bacterium]
MNPSLSTHPASSLFGAIFVALVLSGCASPGSKILAQSGTTLSRIDQELSRASGSLQPGAAVSPDRVSDALLPPLQVELPKAAAEAVEPRFDLVVSKAPAAQVFMAIVANTPYSMLVAPEVGGEISVSLKNVTVREALEALRELYGYDYRVAGNRIHVQSNAMQTRMFQVSYLSGKRSGTSDLRVTASSITSQSSGTAPGSPAAGGGGAPYSGTTTRSVDSSHVSMSSDTDFWGELKLALSALIGTEGGRGVILNPMSGVVLVKGMPQDLRAVENYLRATQLIIERQVMLEAKIVDVSLNDEFQSGINWAYFGGVNNRFALGVAQSGATLATTGILGTATLGVLPGSGGGLSSDPAGKGFFGLSLQSDNFASLIQFLETQGTVQVLSSPRVATLNNQKAVLKVGTDEYYVTNITTTTTTATTGGSTSSPSITLAPFFSGISLDVTPQIDDNSNIILHVHPAVSVVAEKQKVIDLGTLGNFVLPLATSSINETDSIVRVRDGNIVAIGGLMKQDQTDGRVQVPGLGNVPGLGYLFGQRSKALQKRELVILIKPTVIQGGQSWAPDLAETQQRLQEFRPIER